MLHPLVDADTNSGKERDQQNMGPEKDHMNTHRLGLKNSAGDAR